MCIWRTGAFVVWPTAFWSTVNLMASTALSHREAQRGTERHREGEQTQSAQPTAATERHRERRRERRNERAVSRFGPEVVHARLEAFPPRVEMHGREFAEVWRLHEDVQ